MQDGEIVFTVDEKLQSLVQYLLDNGFETYHSCEDDIDGMTTFTLDTSDDIEIALWFRAAQSGTNGYLSGWLVYEPPLTTVG